MGHTVNDLPIHDRPIERIYLKGASSLSSVELLAVIIGSGIRDTNVLQIAAQLVKKSRDLKSLAIYDPHELRNIKGIGSVRAARLAACFEIARRVSGDEKVLGKNIQSPEDFYELLKPLLSSKNTEEFYVICLDSRRKVIAIKKISTGTVNETLVHPREVFKEAISTSSSCIAIAHNHPSGDHSPSDEDIVITKRLYEISRTLGIPLIDHIIFSDNGYASLNKHGYIE